MADTLSDEQVDAALADLPGWRREQGMLRRQVDAGSFLEAIGLVNRIAALAERADHHPDIDIRWRRLALGLVTHSAGGITAKDIDLAGQIEQTIGAGG